MTSFRPIFQPPKLYTLVPGPPPPISTVIIETPPRRQAEPVQIEFDEGLITRMQEEIDVWRNKYFQLELAFQLNAGELKKIDYLENRIKVLQDAIKQLNIEKRQQINENEVLRVKCDELDLDNQDLKMARLENKRLRELLDIAHNELTSAKELIAKLEDDLANASLNEQMIKDQQNTISQLLQEIDIWKKRYTQLDVDRIRGMDEFKKSSETLRNSQFDELRRSGSMQAQGYQNELRNLRIQLERLQQENNELKENIHQLESARGGQTSLLSETNSRLESANKEIKRLNDALLQRGQQNKSLELRIKELERQISEKTTLKEEIEKLKQLLSDKNAQLQDQHGQITKLNNKISELEKQLQESKAYREKIQQMQTEIAQLKAIIKGKDEEIAILKQKINNLEEQLKEIDKIIQEKYQLENKVAMLATEIERKGAQLKNKDKTIDELRSKFDENNQQLATIEQQQQDIDSIQLELKGKDDLVKQFEEKYHEALKYQEQVSQLETQVFDLQGKVAMLSSEIERQRIKLDKYKRDYDGQQDKINELKDKEYDFESMSESIQRFKSSEENQQAEQDNWREQLKKADSDSVELLKTQETLASEKLINQDSLEKLNQQIEQLNALLAEERAKIDGLHKEIEKYQDLENKVYDMQNKTAMLSAEIERRSVKEKTKQKQFDELKEQFNQQHQELERFANIEEENQVLNQSLQKLQAEVTLANQLTEETQGKLDKALEERGNLENKVAMLSTEIERYSYRLKNKIEECSQINEKNQQLQAELLELQELPVQIDQLNEQVEDLRNKLNQADLKQVNLTQQLDAIAHEKAQAEAQVEKIKDEVKLAEQFTTESTKQIEALTGKLKAVEEENSSLRALESKLSEYQMKTALLASQIEAQNKKYQGKLDELATVKQELDDVKQHQLEITDIQGELDRTIAILNEKDKEHATFDAKIKDYEDKILQLEDQKYQLESKMAMVSSEVERVKYKYDKLQKEYEEDHQRLLSVEEELIEVNKENHSLQDELHTTSQELEQLRNLSQNKA